MEKQTFGNISLYCGDCYDVFPLIEPESIDCLLTDPPYSSGGLHISARQKLPGDKYVDNRTKAAHNVNFTGDNRDSRSWTMWCSLWLSQCYDLLRDGGYAMMFTDWRQLPAATDAFQGGGFLWRGIIPWDKTLSSRAPHTGYFRHQCEYVIWGSKNKLSEFTFGGPWPGLYTSRVMPSEKMHMTGKPVPLLQKYLSPVKKGRIVFDPFMGSGSTAIAAINRNLSFIGVEKTQYYFDVACKRVEEAINGN